MTQIHSFKSISLVYLFPLNIGLINNTAYFYVDNNKNTKICWAPIICHALVCISYEIFHLMFITIVYIWGTEVYIREVSSS